MSCYGSLAGYYDKLTGDVPYSKFIEFYEAEFARDGANSASCSTSAAAPERSPASLRGAAMR